VDNKRDKRKRRRKKVCSFCVDKMQTVDYKDWEGCAAIFLKEARSCPEESMATVLTTRDR
jgi:ribosomal protein S18